MKSYWLERKDRFAGCVHRLNVLFEPPRGTCRAELTTVRHEDWERNAPLRTYAIDVADASGVAHIRVLVPQGNVAGPSGVRRERIGTNGCVGAAFGVVIKGERSAGCVALACQV